MVSNFIAKWNNQLLASSQHLKNCNYFFSFQLRLPEGSQALMFGQEMILSICF